MGRSFSRAVLAAALLCAWVAGCSSTPKATTQPKPPPPDPLLMSKKPVEGRPFKGEADQAARFDPTPPALPALPALPGRQFAAPGLQRDPISGVQIGFQSVENDAWTNPAGTTTANRLP